ncbi:MAG: 4-alpha-glucanotransferase [Pseudomonadota bacterium]
MGERQTTLGARQAGVCLHISALPGRYGIGEIGNEAYDFVDTLNRMGMGTWQFLPLGPTAFGNSPYQLLSTFAGNEMLIDTADLVHRGLLSQQEAGVLEVLPGNTVDYTALIPLKSALLSLAAERFARRASARQKAALDAFLHDADMAWLHEYALFRVIKSKHGEVAWTEWLPEFKHHDDDALKRLEADAALAIERIKILQFLFHDQWRRLRRYAQAAGVRLFGDMPICIAMDSADAWANPEILRIDRDGVPECIAGVPPDYFSEDGQLWGNPLYDWHAHRANDFRWWVSRLESAVELADLVRIDHFRGLEALWSIPADAQTARSGHWETSPGRELFEAFRKRLGSLPIVAEDLGVITPAVEALRKDNGIPGMVVLQFEATDPHFSLDTVTEDCVCYTGTHDNDTTLGWYLSGTEARISSAEARTKQATVLALTGGSAETIALDLTRCALQTRAQLAIAPMQDLLSLGSEARFNTPGTAGNNWQWRLSKSQLSDATCDVIAEMVTLSGRHVHSQGIAAHS